MFNTLYLFLIIVFIFNILLHMKRAISQLTQRVFVSVKCMYACKFFLFLFFVEYGCTAVCVFKKEKDLLLYTLDSLF